jgi:hypothetical protein
MPVTLVAISGTFLYKEAPMAEGGGTPRPDYAMLAAVVAAPSQTIFKAWGPEATIDRWRAGFENMVESLEPAR